MYFWGRYSHAIGSAFLQLSLETEGENQQELLLKMMATAAIQKTKYLKLYQSSLILSVSLENWEHLLIPIYSHLFLLALVRERCMWLC